MRKPDSERSSAFFVPDGDEIFKKPCVNTILGVAPLLVDPFFKSMAVTVMFGLLFATALTLVVLPLFYALLFKVAAEKQSGGTR
jgi:hypothetical protein